MTDIHQETNYLYMRVCNLGGSLTDSDTSLALAMKKTGGGIVSAVEPVVLATNDCHEFRIASLDDLGITTSGTYEISAGAVLKQGRTEGATGNNKITRSVSVTYPSKYSSTSQSSIYYQNNNSVYCNSANNYCSSYNYLNNNTYYCSNNNSYSANSYCSNNTYTNNSSTTYYCIPGTSNCSTNPGYVNNNLNYCNASNSYCANGNYYNSPVTYYRNNICPREDYACNYSYYNDTNTQYRNDSNTYCTYSNNYCNNYRKNKETRDCTYSNNYCNNSNSNNYNNNNAQYNQSDLVVQNITQNSSDKHIVAQICNQGGDMNSSTSVRTTFSYAGNTASIYNNLQIGRGQCTSDVVFTTPGELNLPYTGNYSIMVTVDANGNVNERNETNNTLTQNIFLTTDRNQQPDLVVDRVSANDNNRSITSRICNTGDDMYNYTNWIVEITNTTTNSSIRNSGSRLSKGQCMDINTSYSSLGIYRSGGYGFRVVIDPDNALSEQSRWNNTTTQFLQLWTNNY